MRLSLFDAGLAALYLFSLGAVVCLLVVGSSFYATPLAERAHHPGYWVWKAGGSVGQPLGVVGSSMMIAMLLYSARKRFKPLRRLGALSRWLDIHIFLGIVGPALVVLHSSFKVQGLVALSFWSMLAVVLSGFLGRYLYLQIPRTRAGEELTLAELERLDKTLSQRLRSEFRLDERLLARLEALSAPPATRRGLLRGFLALPLDDLLQRRALAAFAAECRSVPRGLLQQFREVLRQKALAHRRILLWDRLHELFHYWHVIHKPFAVVMYLFMAVHVVVAIVMGYGRIGLR